MSDVTKSEPDRGSRLGLPARFIASVERHPTCWLAGCALLLAVQISPWWTPTPDACSYLSMARSLAADGEMTNLGSPHLRFPLGYPVLISPLFLLSERPFLALSVWQWAVGVVWLWGVYHWARGVAPGGAVWIALLAGANAAVWLHFRRTLSEVAFMALLIWIVNLLVTLAEPRAWRAALWRTGVAAAMLVWLVTIRQAGIMLAAGFGIVLGCEALRGRMAWGRAVCLTLAFGLPASAAVVLLARHDAQTAAMAGRQPYVTGFVVEQYAGLGSQLLEGLRLRINDVGRLTIPAMFKAYGPAGDWLDANSLACTLAFILVTAGWWQLARHRSDALVWMWPFYFGLYSLWAWEAGARYFVPVVPLLMASLWYALASWARHRTAIIAGLLIAHLVMSVGYWGVRTIPRGLERQRLWTHVDEMAEAIGQAPGPVHAAGVREDVRLMLQFVLDRPVTFSGAESQLSDAVRSSGGEPQWLVLPRGEPHGEDYVVHRVTGPFQLALRAEGDGSERVR